MNIPEDTSSDKNQTSDDNLLLLKKLKIKIENFGCEVIQIADNFTFIVNNQLKIATEIIVNPNYHPRILHLWIQMSHQEYFPESIEENIVEIGDSTEDKINSVLNNYFDTTFLPIVKSIDDNYKADIAFTIEEKAYDAELGDIGKQGKWEQLPERNFFFLLFLGYLEQVITDNTINWLKVYIARQADGTISGECLFNNQPWNEGMSLLYQYATSWEPTNSFQGLKQFMVFRKN